uniref:Ig-like domain-containing protein n=4 Tax=Lygus hesperus TaxID=30085 RepID=A0A146M972_LYGHE
MQIVTPTSELSGEYYCFVGSFNSESTSIRKKMTVYVPETQMLLYAPRRTTTEVDRKFEVRCEAEGVYPEPNMTISSRERLEASDDVSVHIETTNIDGLYNIQAWIEMVDRGDSNPITFDCILRIPEANYTVHKSIIYYPNGDSNSGSWLAPTTAFLLVITMLLSTRL